VFAVGTVQTVTITGMTACGSTGTSFDISDVVLTYNNGAISALVQKGAKDIVGTCS
jgi:hypothetical protein